MKAVEYQGREGMKYSEFKGWLLDTMSVEMTPLQEKFLDMLDMHPTVVLIVPRENGWRWFMNQLQKYEKDFYRYWHDERGETNMVCECDTCIDSDACEWSYDPYNLEGDTCLRLK